MKVFDVVIFLLLFAIIAIGVVILLMLKRANSFSSIKELEDSFSERFDDVKQDILKTTSTMHQDNVSMVEGFSRMFQDNQNQATRAQQQQIEQMQIGINSQLDLFRKSTDDQFGQVQKGLINQLDIFRKSNEDRLGQVQTGLNSQLDMFRKSTEDRTGRMLQMIESLQQTNVEKLESIRSTMSSGMRDLQESNAKNWMKLRAL